MKVGNLMSKEVFTLKESHRIHLAQDTMNWKRIRHIPVVDEDNHLVGLLTHRDILRISISTLSGISEKDQQDLYEIVRVGDIMQRNVITTTPDTDLRDAASVMIEEKIGCLPVVDNKRLVGILTEADFLTLAWEALSQREPTA